MTVSSTECLSLLQKALKSYWEAKAATHANLSATPPLFFEGDEEDGPPKSKDYWGRFKAEDVLSRPATLRAGTAPSEARRHRTDGVLFVQIFAPRAASHPQSFRRGGKLAEIAQRAFRDQTVGGGIIIRDVTIRRVPLQENGWHQWNVTANFEYDTLG